MSYFNNPHAKTKKGNSLSSLISGAQHLSNFVNDNKELIQKSVSTVAQVKNAVDEIKNTSKKKDIVLNPLLFPPKKEKTTSKISDDKLKQISKKKGKNIYDINN